MAEYARLKALDAYDFENEFPKVDKPWFEFGAAVRRYVKLGREQGQQELSRVRLVNLVS